METKILRVVRQGEAFSVQSTKSESGSLQKCTIVLKELGGSDDKTTYPIQVSGSNYKSKTIFVNESGLYSLILSSKLPQAKAFKRWVTSEVLPQLHRPAHAHLLLAEGREEDSPLHDLDPRRPAIPELKTRLSEFLTLN